MMNLICPDCGQPERGQLCHTSNGEVRWRGQVLPTFRVHSGFWPTEDDLDAMAAVLPHVVLEGDDRTEGYAVVLSERGAEVLDSFDPRPAKNGVPPLRPCSQGGYCRSCALGPTVVNRDTEVRF